MLVDNSTNCRFRPEDKALEMSFASVEEPVPNSFDELLSGNILDLSDNESDKELFENNCDLFFQSHVVISPDARSPELVTSQEETPPEPWKKGLWCLNQGRGPAPDLVVKKRQVGNYQDQTMLPKADTSYATRAPSQLSSPPWTPSQSRVPMSTVEPVIVPVGHTYCRPAFERERTLSPSPMYAQMQHHQPGGGEKWQQDFQNFHLRLPSPQGPTSPSRQPMNCMQAASATAYNSSIVAENAAVASHPAFAQRVDRTMVAYLPNNVKQPYAQVIEPELLVGHDPNQVNASVGQENVAYYQIDHSTIPPHVFPVWKFYDTDTSNNSQYSYEAPQPIYTSEHSPMMWSGSTPQLLHTSMAAGQTQYGHLAAPVPQRLPHQIVQNRGEHPREGLGIHYTLAEARSAQIDDPPALQKTTCISLPAPTLPHFTEIDPFSTPKRSRQHRSPLRSPSPSISPTNTSRVLRQRSPTRAVTEHQRRKSIHKPGPIKDKDRDREWSKAARTPKTVKTPTSGQGGFAAIDFVNFTAKDGEKLLGDVAPSGSSKTRARREQEARDKRKRLGEAALRAVRSAGGDIRALEKAIRA